MTLGPTLPVMAAMRRGEASTFRRTLVIGKMISSGHTRLKKGQKRDEGILRGLLIVLFGRERAVKKSGEDGPVASRVMVETISMQEKS